MAVAPLEESKGKNVLRQVEFYFSDSNLPRDNFLKKTVQESEDGLVSLALLCTFARMRSHLGLSEMKPEEVPEETVLAVAETLRMSPLLKVSEDGKRVGRSTELAKPDEVLEQVDSRTIAASPLPYDVKIEDLESFFGQNGKVNSVRLPRHVADKRHFCGTALIEFSEEEDAKKVLSGSMVYAGAELEIKPKKDFDAEREKMREAFENTRSNKGSSNESDGYPKGLIVAFKLNNIQPEGSTEQNVQEVTDGMECKSDAIPISDGNVDGSEKSSSETIGDNEGKPAEDNENGEKVAGDIPEKTDENAADEVKSTEGSVESREKTVSDKNVITREDLKAIFERFGKVKYIDFRMGEESGYIRFEDSDAATKARAAAVLTDQGGFIVKDKIAMLEPVTGDAEKEYWSTIRGNQKFKGNNRGRGRNNNRGGGRHFDNKRQRQADSFGERPNKAQKVGADA